MKNNFDLYITNFKKKEALSDHDSQINVIEKLMSIKDELKSTYLSLAALQEYLTLETMINACRQVAEAACTDLFKIITNRDIGGTLHQRIKLLETKEDDVVEEEKKFIFKKFLMYAKAIKGLGNIFSHHNPNGYTSNMMDKIIASSIVCELCNLLLMFCMNNQNISLRNGNLINENKSFENKNNKDSLSPEKKKFYTKDYKNKKRISLGQTNKPQTKTPVPNQEQKNQIETKIENNIQQNQENLKPTKRENNNNIQKNEQSHKPTNDSKVQNHKWTFFYGGTWKDYEVDFSKEIEKNYLEGNYFFDLSSKNKIHKLNLKEEVDHVGSNMLLIKRFPVVPVNPTALWQFQKSSSQWYCYKIEHSKIIEENLTNGVMSFSLTINNKLYAIDLSNKTQTDGMLVRKIRREVPL